jgi:hypothetical protein
MRIRSSEKARRDQDMRAYIKERVKKDKKITINQSPTRSRRSPSRSSPSRSSPSRTSSSRTSSSRTSSSRASLRSPSPRKSSKKSPPASGYKYTTFYSPEALLKKGLEENDSYTIKNALQNRNAKITVESVPSVFHLYRLKPYKELSQDELFFLKRTVQFEIIKPETKETDKMMYRALINKLDEIID